MQNNIFADQSQRISTGAQHTLDESSYIRYENQPFGVTKNQNFINFQDHNNIHTTTTSMPFYRRVMAPIRRVGDRIYKVIFKI